MLNDLISALISLAIALVVAFPLGKTLKKHPVPFYLAALVLIAAHLTYKYTGTYIAGAQIFVDIMQKGYLAVFLLAIVMFTGVFDETSAIRRRLQPIRAELSILSFILILSHVAAFLPNYLPRLGSIFNSRANMSISIIIAILLLLVFALLSLLSLRVFRMRMPYRTWKNIQRLSYVMVLLLLLHIVLVLGRPAFAGHGSTSALVALIIYVVLAVAYAVARIAKAVRDRKKKAAEAEKTPENAAA